MSSRIPRALIRLFSGPFEISAWLGVNHNHWCFHEFSWKLDILFRRVVGVEGQRERKKESIIRWEEWEKRLKDCQKHAYLGLKCRSVQTLPFTVWPSDSGNSCERQKPSTLPSNYYTLFNTLHLLLKLAMATPTPSEGAKFIGISSKSISLAGAALSHVIWVICARGVGEKIDNLAGN